MNTLPGYSAGRLRNLARLLFFVFVGIPDRRHGAAWRRLLICAHQVSWGALNTAVGLASGFFAIVLLGGQVFRWNSVTVVVVQGRAHAAATLGPVVVGIGVLPDDVLDHELGHWYQSILLGPLYFLVVGLPSALHFLWFESRPRASPFLYYRFYTEAWADAWGGVWHCHDHVVEKWWHYLAGGARCRRSPGNPLGSGGPQ